MKIVILTGSPREHGASSYLVEQFIKGAREKGHEVFRFDAGLSNDIHSCSGCDVCGMNGPCMYKDDIEKNVTPRLVACNMVVLATPLYFYGVSGQLKTCIDRFYSRTGQISSKKSALLVSAASKGDIAKRAIGKYYATLASYMDWRNQGVVIAEGCPDRETIEKTDYGKQAYELGKKL